MEHNHLEIELEEIRREFKEIRTERNLIKYFLAGFGLFIFLRDIGIF